MKQQFLKPGEGEKIVPKRAVMENILMTEKDDIFRRFGGSHTALSSYQATEGLFGHEIAEFLLLFRGF